MHASSDAKRNRASRSSFKRANHFSFPPTQRMGLLDPTTCPRSSNQHANLERSYRNLLSALNMAPMQHHAA